MYHAEDPILVADIGGTNARFALASNGELRHAATLPSGEFGGLEPAIAAYFELLDDLSFSPLDPPKGTLRPRRAAIAVASPITGDRVELTNLDWDFSIAETRREVGFERLVLINDFEAQALALADLGPDGLEVLHDAEPMPEEPRVVLGPGTGLGVATLVMLGERRLPLDSEGGHRDAAATTEREWRVFEHVRQEYAAESNGHLSCERLVSGPGLAALQRAVARLAGAPLEDLDPADVVERSRGGCALCREAIEIFCSQLGSFAGDLALTLGAQGGVFLAGGVLGNMEDAFRLDLFRERFLAKGRFRDYLERIPVYRVVHPNPGLVGAARAFD